MSISHKSEMNGMISKALHGVEYTCYIWWQEMKLIVKDEGVLMFVLLVPLAYPLLYSWIYNNEVVREVPVAVVDESRSALSREFARKCDASPDVRVACYAADMDEAQSLLKRQEVSGIYRFPSDFATRINRMQQATVGVYCDMGIMLKYKAIFQTATAVSQDINAHIQIAISGNYTDREDEISAQPLDFDEVALFNPSGGYGSFILPMVLVLIIQQTLLLGIGMSAGTARENNRYRDLIPISRHYQNIYRVVIGKSLCYFMIYAVLAAYLLVVVPRLFHFPAIGRPADLMAITLPYILACIFFGLTLSCMIRYRENVMLLVVFTSVPLLFLMGISWPQSNMPDLWRTAACLFPSTFGGRAYVRLNSMGATLDDVLVEYRALWIQVAVYFFLACSVYRYQIYRARAHALEQLYSMRRKREMRTKQAGKGSDCSDNTL